MMEALASARRIGEGLDEDHLPYGIGGALALGVWGAPRMTLDVDISVFVGPGDVVRVLDSLERIGVMVKRDQAVRDIERVGFAKGRLGIVVVDVFISQHPQFAAMAKRVRRIVDASGWSAAFISAEDLCLYKLVYYRDKDLVDLQHLFAARTDLDTGYIREWLGNMFPAGDPRLAMLDELERRFLGA
ncbi:MAG: hypothetical protein ABI467_01340 [Kofleriaceae bacterium]